MEKFRRKDIPLVTIIGISSFKKPYTTHNPTPNNKMVNIIGDTSITFLVRQDFIIWGTTAKVVKVPAKIPIIVTVVIRIV